MTFRLDYTTPSGDSFAATTVLSLCSDRVVLNRRDSSGKDIQRAIQISEASQLPSQTGGHKVEVQAWRDSSSAIWEPFKYFCCSIGASALYPSFIERRDHSRSKTTQIEMTHTYCCLDQGLLAGHSCPSRPASFAYTPPKER